LKIKNSKLKIQNTTAYPLHIICSFWMTLCRLHSKKSKIKPALVLFWLILLGGCMQKRFVRSTPQMDAEPRFWVRVLLLDNAKDCTLTIRSSFTVTDAQTETLAAHFGRTNVPASVSVSAAKITIDGQSFAGDEIIISPDDPYIFNLNGDDYRGRLKLILDSDGSSFDAVNLVPLEPYLAGVVGAEMPYYWEPAALQAQAIAARTYCLYIKRRFGSRRSWDLRRTQANQVYLGISAESPQIWNAVNQTRGQVLVCKQPDGTEDIFPTYYSSICGGHTENSSNVFGDSFGPLTGVRCPYCIDVAKPAFFFWPMARFDKDYVTDKLVQNYPKLKLLGEIVKITPTKQSAYENGKFSRLTSIKLTGSTGKSDFVRAEDFRLTIDPTGNKLKSTICQIVNKDDKWEFLFGRGYGHGVGMCQCGAQAMAREGKNAREIILYYYPGSKIVSVY